MREEESSQVIQHLGTSSGGSEEVEAGQIDRPDTKARVCSTTEATWSH